MHTLVRRENRERDGDESETDRDSKRGAVRASLSCRVELVRERDSVRREFAVGRRIPESSVCDERADAMREQSSM